MKIKYLMMDNLGYFGTNDGYVLFPELENHVAMSKKLGGKEHVTGAGFVRFLEKEGRIIANCYGKSESLNIGVGENDSKIITMFTND